DPDGIATGNGRLDRGRFRRRSGPETRARHAVFRNIVLHELLPHETRARVFRHHQSDADVDANHVRAVPVGERVEGVHEAVSPPGAIFVLFANGAQHAHRFFGQEGQRSAGRAWDDAAVDSAHGGRAAPNRIAARGIRGGQTPEVVSV